MTLNELLSIEKVKLTRIDLFDYFDTVKFENLLASDVEKIIEHFGAEIFDYTGFSEIYFAVTSRESDNVMKLWTRWIGWFTIAIGIMTLIMLLKDILFMLQQ